MTKIKDLTGATYLVPKLRPGGKITISATFVSWRSFVVGQEVKITATDPLHTWTCRVESVDEEAGTATLALVEGQPRG